MKKINYALLLLLFGFTLTIAQTKWSFDKSHSKVGFSVTHMVITDVDGNFKEFDGTIETDGDNFENAKITFTANVNSIYTENEKRDNHLKSPDFFDAKSFPKLTFVSKSMKKVDDKHYKLVGDLTIRDKTKEVTLDVKFNGTVTDPWGNTRAGFKLEGEVNRFDFDLKWNKMLETGGLVAGEDVTITAKFELIKQK